MPPLPFQYSNPVRSEYLIDNPKSKFMLILPPVKNGLLESLIKCYANMNSSTPPILLIVRRPEIRNDTSNIRWREFSESARTIEARSKDIRVLSSNAWLLPTQPDLRIAQELCSAATTRGLRYEAYFCNTVGKDILGAIDPFA